MTATLAEFAAQQDARNTNQLNVTKWSLILCDTLTERAPTDYTFQLDSSGRKYHKIYMYINGKRDSIHAFIDKKTGSLLKPASIKSPAKGERFNLLVIKDREWLLENATWCGNYLYKR
jgi:hypothetical protein